MYAAAAPTILSKHKFSQNLDYHPRKGNVCEIYFTDEVVLKIPKHKNFYCSADIEARAGPIALEAGVLTAELLVYNNERTLVPAPYTIWRRLPGSAPGPDSPVWARIGEQLAKLHSSAPVGDRPRTDRDGSPLHRLEQPDVKACLRSVGVFDRVVAWAKRLEVWRDGAGPVCFLHTDMHRHNILVTEADELSGIVDWGDAGYGDPAYDLSRAPYTALPPLLESYLTAGGDLGEHAMGRILRYRLARILRWRGTEEDNDLSGLLKFASALPLAWRAYGI